MQISGGIAGNVIPDSCVLSLNYRFAPDRTIDQAAGHVREVFAGHAVEVVDAAPAARPGLDHPAAAQFLSAVGGSPAPKFGWTDVARLAELGIPAVNFGPGNPNKAHADNEHCAADDIVTARSALLAWLS